jgi:Anti-sigma-K factor rskA
MMSDERPSYLETGAGTEPHDVERLERVRGILARPETWAEPPQEVAQSVLAAINGETSGDSGRTSAARRWAIGGVAAAAAVIAVVVGVVVTRPSSVIVEMDGTELAAQASGEAVLRNVEAGWWIRLDVSGLPATGPDQYYEGWLWSDEGDGVSVGTFHLRGGDGPVTLWSGVDPAGYPSLWVTLEDEDGDPAASSRVMMRGRTPTEG